MIQQLKSEEQEEEIGSRLKGIISSVSLGPEQLVTVNWHNGNRTELNISLLNLSFDDKVKPEYDVGDRVFFHEACGIVNRKYPLGIISRMSYPDEDLQLFTIQWDCGVISTHQSFDFDSVEKTIQQLSQPVPKD